MQRMIFWKQRNNEINIRAPKWYVLLSLLSVLYFYSIILIIPKIDPYWAGFPDVNDYKLQSEASIFSSDFISPSPKPGVQFFPRPFTVPLFFKMADSDPYKMIMLQKWVYCLCVTVLVFVLIMFVEGWILKMVTTNVLLFFFSWWNIVGWSEIPVSESISLSLMFLWFATAFFYYKKPNRTSLIIMIFVAILLSFTRDTWPYIILLFAVINIFTVKFNTQYKLKNGIAFFLVSIVLFLFQSYTANVGERFRLPVFNSIAGRVSHNDKYLEWFENEGMPQVKQLKADFGKVSVDREGRFLMYKKYVDGTYDSLFTWVRKDGKKAYQKFLLTHPAYLFLTDVPNNEFQENILCDKLAYYYPKAEGFFVNAGNVFPVLNGWLYFVVFLVLITLWKETKDFKFIFLLTIFLLFLANALLSYDADSMEIQRHLFITRVGLEFVGVVTFLFGIDYTIAILNKRKTRNSLTTK